MCSHRLCIQRDADGQQQLGGGKRDFCSNCCPLDLIEGSGSSACLCAGTKAHLRPPRLTIAFLDTSAPGLSRLGNEIGSEREVQLGWPSPGRKKAAKEKKQVQKLEQKRKVKPCVRCRPRHRSSQAGVEARASLTLPHALSNSGDGRFIPPRLCRKG